MLLEGTEELGASEDVTFDEEDGTVEEVGREEALEGVLEDVFEDTGREIV